MIIIISLIIIAACTTVAILKSKRPLKHILAEAKYEVFYNIMGSRALMDDFLMKRSNKTELLRQTGKIAVITGGTRGIGLEVIKMLLKCDIHIVIGCRNVELGKTLIKAFRDEDIKTGDISVYQLDISSLESVRIFSKIVKEKHPKLNYLINNAGKMFGPFEETVDGYESQFATNYLGHFFLTHFLLENLASGGKDNDNSRIVNVSSCAYLVANMNFEDINNRIQYIPAAAYGESKLAQILFTLYLNDLMLKKKLPVQVHAVHPGIVNTELFDGTRLKTYAPWVPSLFFKTPEQGAFPIVYACLSKDLEGKGGTYINNCKTSPVKPAANEEELQERLFEFTKKLLKIDNFGNL